MLRLVILCVAAVVGVSGAARSDPLHSGPDWSGDRFLLGRWSCDLTRPDHESAREQALYSLGLADHWLKLTYTKSSDTSNMPPLMTEAYETFDEQQKKWVYVSFGSDGNYGLAYSDGWKNGIKTYGPGPDQKVRWRLIAKKVSDREFTEEVERVVNGQWSHTSSLRCTKSN